MLSYQKYHYNQYRIIMDDGTEIKASREECFAPGEAPTEDRPFKQRWYYSPDRTLAIRLPRNEKGEMVYHTNVADLRSIEREEERKNSCVGQYGKTSCHITCGNCQYRDECFSELMLKDGHGCKKKCECCSSRTGRFSSMDKPVDTDDGETFSLEYDSGDNIELTVCQADENYAYIEDVKKMVNSLEGEEKLLFECIRNGMTLAETARLLDVHVNTVLNRKEKLMEKFSADNLRQLHEREEMVRNLVDSLSDEERLIYSCIQRKMTLEEMATFFGKHENTISNWKRKLREKFIAAGLEKYF